jgi:hypothetical protein
MNINPYSQLSSQSLYPKIESKVILPVAPSVKNLSPSVPMTSQLEQKLEQLKKNLLREELQEKSLRTSREARFGTNEGIQALLPVWVQIKRNKSAIEAVKSLLTSEKQAASLKALGTLGQEALNRFHL